jgi:hypothetical protein
MATLALDHYLSLFMSAHSHSSVVWSRGPGTGLTAPEISNTVKTNLESLRSSIGILSNEHYKYRIHKVSKTVATNLCKYTFESHALCHITAELELLEQSHASTKDYKLTLTSIPLPHLRIPGHVLINVLHADPTSFPKVKDEEWATQLTDMATGAFNDFQKKVGYADDAEPANLATTKLTRDTVVRPAFIEALREARAECGATGCSHKHPIYDEY